MTADLRNLAIISETEKAIRVRQDLGPSREQVLAWVPKSQIDYIKRHGPLNPDGTKACDIKIPAWLADEKGFSW